jgi:hypothetical protein
MHRIDPWTPKALELAEPVPRIADDADKRLMMVPSHARVMEERIILKAKL